MVPNPTAPSDKPRPAVLAPVLAAVLAAAGLLLAGCAGGGGAGSALADSYYFFLRSQYDELLSRDKEAMESMEKAVAAAPGSPYLNVEAAKLYSRTGRSELAAQRAARAVEQDPRNVDARLLGAWLAATEAQWEEAEEQYAGVLKIDPYNEEALSYLGALYAENGRMDLAEETFRRLARQAPDLYLPDYYLGRLAQRREDAEGALRHYRQSLKKNPYFAPALTETAYIYEVQNKLGRAEEAYRKLIALQPDSTVPQARLAHIMLKTGRKDQAVEILKQLSQRYPQSNDAVHAAVIVGLAYIDEGMLREAGDEFEGALRTNPDNDTLKYLLASVLAELGDRRRARTLLDGIPDTSQYFVDSKLLLCSVMLSDDQPDQAASMIARARTVAPDAPQLVLAQGTVFEERGRFPEAREIYVKALPDFPKAAEIYFRLAYVEDMLGNKSAAVKNLRQTIDLDPGHAEALNYLAYTWAEQGVNLDEALVMALKANALKPNNGHIVDTVAWIYFNMGDLKKSLPLLKQAALLSNGDPVVLEHLGDVLLKSGLQSEARQAYARAIERGHDKPGVINEKLQNIAD
ncbi:MAG: tetratricopeptide repeat protein [Deltaproteobacteria bacterium]|nr:tetratricopeptide repeat protein [Deltaproteobacteria bacterium]